MPHCTIIFEHFLGILSSRPSSQPTSGHPRRGRQQSEAATLRPVLVQGLEEVSDRRIRFGMIALDAAPTIVHLRGAPIIFHSPEETI